MLEEMKGLTTEEAKQRLNQYGPNKLIEKKKRTVISIIVSQFKNPLIYIITVAACISILLKKYDDAIIIGIVILIDAIVGAYQEYRAEATMDALKGLLKPVAHVLRDNSIKEIEVVDVVPGDIVILNSGDKISADGELIESVNLALNESILTGESENILKNINDTVFMGTSVVAGRGKMHVKTTGTHTQLGKIAESLLDIKNETTPLQIRLETFGKSLTIMVIIISGIIMLLGIILKYNILEMIELSVVLAIAAIPEGLLIAVTMILVIGMRSILKQKGLVKKLLAVETLGSVTTICTDKTGTLTEGIMQVVKFDCKDMDLGIKTILLCNNEIDSMDISLLNYASSQGLNIEMITSKNPRISEIPFSSERKYMQTVNQVNGSEIGFLKGAPDIIMNLCKIKESEKDEIIKKIDDWAGNGLRLLALAHKIENPSELKDYIWNGLIGIQDPIRPSVKDSINLCRRAGIKVKMITGDYRKTAEQVGMNLGLALNSEQIIEGKDLEKMSEEDLSKKIGDLVVFSRVSPIHKLKIVNALQKNEEIIAMIGDGVNDAPALKKANIGVSVGNGTDVAKETASLILLDNNFATLVSAVKEGRVIYDNIKKVVAFVLSNSFAEIFIIIGAFLLRWPSPLNVAQILWIHLICDGPSDIALGFEKEEKGVMDERPKSLTDNILNKKTRSLILIISCSSGLLSLLIFYHFWQLGNEILGQTIVFSILGIQSLIYIFSYRSLNQSIFKAGNPFSNKPLMFSVILGISQILLGLYIPLFRNMLKVIPLNLYGWIFVLGVSFSMIILVEFVKFIDRKVRGTPTQQVYKILKNVQTKMPEINNLHNISVDIMRDKILIQFHFELPSETPLESAHQIASKIEERISMEFPPNMRHNLDIISHIEPIRFSNAKVHSHTFRQISSELYDKIAKIIRETPNVRGLEHLEIMEEGKELSISFTAFFDNNINIATVHHSTEEIEAELRKNMPNLKRCVIHTAPIQK